MDQHKMKVSVAMITYNHERFIAQAIESVLMQETSFDYELVIGEDCSTDRTREIVVDFQQRFPEMIRVLLHDQNVGTHENFARTLAGCTGQYIALLEGDDYWISPDKLQKQVEFLDSDLMCSICFHPVNWLYEDDHVAGGGPGHNTIWPQNHRGYSTMEDLLNEMFIQTGSVMFRNALFGEYPEWFHELKMADWPMYVLIAQKGKIGCLDEVMSSYRRHSGGISFGTEDETHYREAIKMYEFLNTHFDYRYARIIRPLLAESYLKLGVLYDQRGSFEMARPAVARSVATHMRSKTMPRLNSLKMLARLSFPYLYTLSKRLRKSLAL